MIYIILLYKEIAAMLTPIQTIINLTMLISYTRTASFICGIT